MTAERRRRALELFRRALDVGAAEREALLDEACSGDDLLRDEVHALFRARDEMGPFLEAPAADALVRASAGRVPALSVGARVGTFEVVRLVSRGATGAVYEAVQDRPRRSVALKVLRAGLASSAERRRFLDEADVLARLDHPGVARVLAAGLHPLDGAEVPWLALELVDDGRPVTESARDRGLDARACALLVAEACDAVHHAHQKGILHRDLKPANVLVDGRGRIKVIDFGIAQEIGAHDANDLSGTIAYMSPEQADRAAGTADARSDVYALGAILHELLVGRPFRDVDGLSVADALALVRAASEPATLHALGRERAAIVGKALAPRREDRYQSVAALGDDLRRHLAHHAVEAVRGGAAYHLSSFARRQPALCTALATLVVLSVAAGVVGTRLAVDKERERASAAGQAYVASVAAAQAALGLGDVASARRHLERAPRPLRNWEWHHLSSRLDTSESTLRWGDHCLRTGALGPDGTSIAASGWPRDANETTHRVRVWNRTTGSVAWTVDTGTRRADALAFASSGDLLAVGFHDGTLELRAAADGGLISTLPGHGAEDRPMRERHVNDAQFLGDDSALVTCSGDGSLRVWDLSDGGGTRALVDDAVRLICLDVARDGSRVAVGRIDGTALIVDLHSGAVVHRLRAHEASVDGIAMSSDGTRCVTTSRDRTARLWRLPDGELLATAAVHLDNVRDVAFSPAGDVFAVASWDRTLTLLHASDGRRIARLRGHEDVVERVAFLPDGDRVISFARDGTLKSWRLADEHEPRLLGGYGDAVTAIASHAGSELVVGLTSPRGNDARAWDLPSGRMLAAMPRGAWNNGSALLLPAGSMCLVGVEPWSLPGLRPAAGPRDARGVPAISADGHTLFAGGRDGGTLGAWRTDTWERTSSWACDAAPVVLAATANGDRLIAGAADGTVSVWEVSTGRAIAARDVTSRSLRRIALHPDGTTVAVCDGGSDVVLLRLESLQQVGRLSGHASEAMDVAFSPDGTRLATASLDATVRLWDIATLEQVAVLDTRPDAAFCVSFADRGRTLLVGTGVLETSGAIRVWTAPGFAPER